MILDSLRFVLRRRPWPPALTMLAAAALAAPARVDAALTTSSPLEVRILYDNSGSMYPGYAPDSGRSRLEMGVPFLRDQPAFARWLQDFAAHQGILHARTVAMAALTSSGRFTAGDLRTVHEPAPRASFDAAAALRRVAAIRDAAGRDWGLTTHLQAGLEAYSRGFEGLIWLITDNYVDTGDGDLDHEVVAFFHSLRDLPRYRSVHLFKLPFDDREHRVRSDLAIYAVLVSPDPLDEDTAAYFDRKFRDAVRNAERPGGGPLFDGHEHLKLKDLSVAPFDLRLDPALEVDIVARDRGLFRERQTVRLSLPATIHSNLTQHTVTAGRYTLAPLSSFQPDQAAREAFGVAALDADAFEPVSGTLAEVIPPNGSYPLDNHLSSLRPVSLRLDGPGSWLKAAVFGVRVTYTATVALAFHDLELRFERDRMAGIFGAEKAPEIFGFTQSDRIQPPAERAEIHFTLTSGSRRGLLLAVVLLPLLAVLGGLLWLLGRSERYRLTVDGTATVVALRRLQRHDLGHQGRRLGTLYRGLDGGHRFAPSQDDVAVTVEPGAEDGHWTARLRGGGAVPFSIVPVRRGRSRGGSDGAAASGRGRRPGGQPPGGRRPAAAPTAAGGDGRRAAATAGPRPAAPRPGVRQRRP